MSNKVRCPNCGSENIIKAGFVYKAGIGKVQRYYCKDCYHYFVEDSDYAYKGVDKQ